MALLKKRQSDEVPKSNGTISKNKDSLPEELTQFLSLTTKSLDRNRIRIKNEMVYYLPEGFPEHARNLRFLRTGLLLGEMKKGRFEPAQAFAMALKAEEFKQRVCWEKSDERVIRYLKGETISLKEEEGQIKGWCLVCVDGFPLGFAKGTGSTLKNKYYPGWRWQ